MKNKKIIVLLSILVLLVAVFCSCNKEEQHTHNFSSDYSTDDVYHWQVCQCGEKSGYGQHAWNNGVVTLKPTTESEGERTFTCSVCRAKKIEKIDKLTADHAHIYDIWSGDENYHWNECLCGERNNVENHSFDNGTVTTPAGDVEVGIKTFTCSNCGCKKTEVIPASSSNGMTFVREAHHKITGRLQETPLTIEAEIKVSKGVNRPGAIFGNYLGLALKQIWQFEIYDNGVPRFYYADNGGNIRDIMFNSVDVRTGEWMHIAFTFDFENATMSLYIDGALVETLPCEYDLAPDATRYEFTLGGDNRSNNGLYFQGQIRSVATYSDVRTEEEIKASAEKGTNLYADDLLACYFVNENSRGNEIKDLSGNGYNIPKEWLDSHETTIDYAYSFAVVGDTQWLSKNEPEKMEGIYDWIVENAESKKIAHVFGLGDITEDWNTADKEQEWIRAHQYISKLNGVVPYSLVRGNHDEAKYFTKYFDNDTYKSQFDGFMNGDITNSYMLVTIGSVDYLFMTLDYGASDEMLAWASEIIVANPDRRVIITTHGYMALDETPLHADNDTQDINSGNDVNTSVGNNIRDYNNGKAMWEEFLSKHPNIFLLLCGHTAFEDVILYQSEGEHGNVVNQMVIDPQWMDPQKGGVGMVCMLYFSADGTQMEVEWISTDTGKYYKEQNQFVLDLTDSLNAPPHSFEISYNDKYHYNYCECGYTFGDTAHVYDGGVIDSDGFVVYTCDCGYKKVTSATDDPTAKDLQNLLDSYYNGGVYYKDNSINSVFYNGNKYVIDGVSYDLTDSDLTLEDIILGKFGDLKLDLGWNCHDGVYSSANASTIEGIKLFAGVNAEIGRVTVEEDGSILVIKLYSGKSVYSEVKIGLYAMTTLVDLGGEIIDVLYTKSGNDYMIKVETPTINGYISEYDYFILDTRHNELTRTVYYSTITVWDGVSVSTSLKGSGTESDPFLVESGADLAYIANVINSNLETSANFLGKHFKLTQSIDLNGKNLNLGSYPGWANRRGFYGFFDGNHCTIRGLNNNGNSLFGTIEIGWLKNLSVYGKANGSTTIGGIVGYVANGGVLENLTSYVTVTGNDTLGGIVGNAESKSSDVINCVNYGSVTATSYIVGGIAGSGGHNITSCVNFGDVTSTTNDVVGGICGSTKTTGAITNCYNYGNIKARGKAAGIAGQSNNIVKSCVNYGNVSGTWALGGVVGFINTDAFVTIDSCVNWGTVTASTTGNGGILGIYYNAATGTGNVTIKYCVNNGDVSGSWGIGGIAGDTLGKVIGCVNNGQINAKGELGGIVGKCYGSITECTNNGEIRGAQTIIGGIVGHLYGSTYLDVINTTNYQNGTVIGPKANEIIGTID